MRSRARRHVDWIAIALFISLVIIGWLMIYAAGYERQADLPIINLGSPAGKQLLFIGVSLVIFFLVFLIDTKFWRTIAYPLYGISLLGLILVLLIGTNIKGSTSWFVIGSFSIQPSEFVKFTTCLAIAGYLSYYRTDLKVFKYQLGAMGLFALPILLILLQPDAGSALVFTSFFLVLYREGMPVLIYLAGIVLIGLFVAALLFPPFLVASILLLLAAAIISSNLKDRTFWLAGFIILALAEVLLWPVLTVYPVLILNFVLLCIAIFRRLRARSARQLALVIPATVLSLAYVFLVNFGFTSILEPHQQDRINVWLRPELCDPRGSLYNVLQSKIAIGSGGVSGKGFLEGTMTNLNFVPEQTTDFIFSTIGEEQGLIGSVGIILLYTFLLLRIIVMAERMRSDFARQYAYGVLGLLFVHFFINIGMTMGIVPIIGIPLPFISYGGSSLIAFTIMLAVLIKMDSNRFER